MARKTIKMGKSTRRKLSTFADDFPPVETEAGSGRALAKRTPSVKTGEPSGGPLAKRGSTEVGKSSGSSNKLPARASGDLGDADFKDWWKKGKSRAPGIASRLMGGAALMAHSPDVGEGSDKPRNYPGEGLSPVGPPAPVKAAPTKAATAPAAKAATANKPAPKPASSAPAAKSSAATPKPKAKPASASSKSSAEYDDWLADLRGSAARMKAETSRAAEKTGALKEKAGAFSQSFKKGGSVKSRGDGIAQRGRTKGRFV